MFVISLTRLCLEGFLLNISLRAVTASPAPVPPAALDGAFFSTGLSGAGSPSCALEEGSPAKVLKQKVLKRTVMKQKVLKRKVLKQKVLKHKVLKRKVLKRKVPNKISKTKQGNTKGKPNAGEPASGDGGTGVRRRGNRGLWITLHG